MPIDELAPVEPLKVEVRLPAGVRGRSVRLLVAGVAGKSEVERGWAKVELAAVLDHEVLVIE
jgi:hypothetical protein